jgi:hypothetical protein
VIRWPVTAVVILAACASAPVNVVVNAEPWLHHESALLQTITQRYVREYVRSSTPITVTIQLERAVFDRDHGSLIATCVVADASGQTIERQTVRVQHEEFDEAGRAIAQRVARVISGS